MKTRRTDRQKDRQTDEIPARSGLEYLCLQPGLVLPGEAPALSSPAPSLHQVAQQAAVPLPLGGPSWSPQVSVEEGTEHPPHFLALPRALRARH